MKLADYLKKEAGLSNETIQLFDSLTETVELPKGAQILSEGSHSKTVYYIEKGLIRLYYFKDGKDITHFFHFENSLYAPIENIFLNQYFPYHVETLEPTTLRIVDYLQIEKYIDENPSAQRFVRLVLTNTLKTLADHLNSIQHQTAQERYASLLKNHPNILQRVALGHIASYIGITQSTLSVIRADFGK